MQPVTCCCQEIEPAQARILSRALGEVSVCGSTAEEQIVFRRTSSAERFYFAAAIPAMPSCSAATPKYILQIGPIARTNWPDQRSALAKLR